MMIKIKKQQTYKCLKSRWARENQLKANKTEQTHAKVVVDILHKDSLLSWSKDSSDWLLTK